MPKRWAQTALAWFEQARTCKARAVVAPRSSMASNDATGRIDNIGIVAREVTVVLPTVTIWQTPTEVMSKAKLNRPKATTRNTASGNSLA